MPQCSKVKCKKDYYRLKDRGMTKYNTWIKNEDINEFKAIVKAFKALKISGAKEIYLVPNKRNIGQFIKSFFKVSGNERNSA